MPRQEILGHRPVRPDGSVLLLRKTVCLRSHRRGLSLPLRRHPDRRSIDHHHMPVYLLGSTRPERSVLTGFVRSSWLNRRSPRPEFRSGPVLSASLGYHGVITGSADSALEHDHPWPSHPADCRTWTCASPRPLTAGRSAAAMRTVLLTFPEVDHPAVPGHHQALPPAQLVGTGQVRAQFDAEVS